MNFYLILQKIMDEKGLKIPDVARKCGLSDGTIRSAIVRKSENVSLEVAFKIADGLGVSLERLNGMPEKGQFYAEKEITPSADESAPGDEVISIEESNHLLEALGLIQKGQELSDDDLAFLTHVIGLLDAWFRKDH